MGKKVYLTIHVDIWLKKIWHVKAGKRVFHKTLAVAREYAKERGYAGIRVRFASLEKSEQSK